MTVSRQPTTPETIEESIYTGEAARVKEPYSPLPLSLDLFRRVAPNRASAPRKYMGDQEEEEEEEGAEREKERA